MGERFSLFAAFVALLLGALIATSAQARTPIFSDGCFLATDRLLGAEDARATDGWDCPGDVDLANSHHGWLSVDLSRFDFGDEPVMFESDNAFFDGLLIAREMPDGSLRTSRVSARDAARHWTMGTRFSIPLFEAGDKPDRLMIRFDRPFSRNLSVQADLVPQSEAVAFRETGMMWFSMLFGMLLVSMAYSLVMAVALRHIVTLYHAAMTGLIALYTLSSSALIFALYPDTSLVTRTMISFVTMPLSFALFAPFCLSFLEPDALSPFARKSAYAGAAIMVMIALVVPLFGFSYPIEARHFYHLAFTPAFLIYGIVIVSAFRRGSKAVKFIAAAWTLPVLAGIDRVLRGMDLYASDFAADYAFFIAIACESMIIAIGVAWRITDVRRQRDRALAQEIELNLMAWTDALTGLPNRRAFDQRNWRNGDYFAILDFDCFKRINDNFGHQTGDDVIRAGASALQELASEGLIVGAWRLGGEEFAALCSARPCEEAALLFNRARDRISGAIATAVPQIGERVSVSAGLAQIGRPGIVPAYEAADRALYHAKSSGRDRLCYESAEREVATIFPRRGKLPRRRRAA